MTTTHKEEAPRWWQLPWKTICSFPVGVGMLAWETVAVEKPNLAILLAGLAMCGVLPAAAVREYIKKMIGD